MTKFTILGLGLSLFLSTVGCANALESSSTEDEGSPTDDAAEVTTENAAAGSGTDTTSTAQSGVTAVGGESAPAGDANDGEEAAPARAEAGPKPAAACTVSKDKNGFFWRTSSKSAYVAYVPASYTGNEPMRLVVGLHGCSDEAMNFASWGVNPYDGRKTQNYIGISVSGETGNNKCWSMGNDDAKVLAAVEDISKCFWVDQAKVVIAGYSSGGQLAYRVGMSNADKFAGILIENSAMYAAGIPSSSLLGGQDWKLPIAHRAATGDGVFPIAKVKADWALIKAAGNPIQAQEVSGNHSGSSADWLWLHAQAANWVRPQ